MSDKKILALEKIGYTKNIPKRSNLENFDTISIKNKSGENINLYRKKSKKAVFDEISDFNKSWDVYNNYLD